MNQDVALKNFNFEKHMLGETESKIPFLPTLDSVLFFASFLIITHYECTPYFPALYPLHYPLILGVIYILSGFIPLKVMDLNPDQKADPIGRIVLGFILLSYIFISTTSLSIIPLWKIFLFTGAIKNILTFIIRTILLNHRCSLSVKAGCVGVLQEEVSHNIHKSYQNIYHPVWEYKAQVPEKELNEDGIIPVMESVMVEKTFRHSLTPRADWGTPRYGDSRTFRINPEDPEDIFDFDIVSIVNAVISIPILIAAFFAITFAL